MVKQTAKGWAFKVTPEILAALERRRIYLHRPKQGQRIPTGEAVHFHDECAVEPYCAVLEGRTIPTIGAFTCANAGLLRTQVVGRYCSIGADVTWMGSQHPLDRLSTATFAFQPGMFLCETAIADAASDFEITPSWDLAQPAHLEHDVWIGEGAYIGKDVVLKTGCVVGGRAVVTKTVEPYSIVVGNPARVVRLRFPEPIVEALLASRWWDYPFHQFAGMPIDQPERFLGEFHEAREKGRLQPLPPARPFLEIVREAEAEVA